MPTAGLANASRGCRARRSILDITSAEDTAKQDTPRAPTEAPADADAVVEFNLKVSRQIDLRLYPTGVYRGTYPCSDRAPSDRQRSRLAFPRPAVFQ